MYIKNLIESIEQNKDVMNERVYRTMIAKAYVLFFAMQYKNKSEIQYQVNLKLLEKGMKHISYMFVTDTLKEK